MIFDAYYAIDDGVINLVDHDLVNYDSLNELVDDFKKFKIPLIYAKEVVGTDQMNEFNERVEGLK